MTFWETISNRAYWKVIVMVFANFYPLDMLQSIQNPILFKQNHNDFIDCIVMRLFEPPRFKLLHSSMLNIIPHCFIGVIRLRNSKGQTLSVTGTLISSKIVLTSAHPLFNIGKMQITEMRPFEFVLNLHGDLENPRTIRVPIVDYRYPQEYEFILRQMFNYKPSSEEYQNSYLEGIQHDYALLHLEKQVKLPTSSYPILVQGYQEKNKYVTVCGYSQMQNKQIMHSNTLQFSPQFGGRYDIDTQSGQSGSPVYFMEKVSGKEVAHVVGIHKGYDRIKGLNVCTLLTEEIINQLRQWEKQWLVSTKGVFRVRQAEENTPIPDNVKKMNNNLQFPTNISGGKSKEPKIIQKLIGNKADLIAPQDSIGWQGLIEKYGTLKNFQFAEVSCKQEIKIAIKIVQGTNANKIDFILNCLPDDNGWIKNLEKMVNKQSLPTQQMDLEQVLKQFEKNLSKKKNLEQVYLIQRLIKILLAISTVREKEKQLSKSKHQEIIDLTRKIQKIEKKQMEIEQHYQDSIKDLQKRHQQELQTLEYWLVEAQQLHKLANLNIKDHKLMERLERLNEFTISIDRREEGSFQSEQLGNSIISSSVALQKQDQLLRKEKRIILAETIQKYEEIITDLRPQDNLHT